MCGIDSGRNKKEGASPVSMQHSAMQENDKVRVTLFGMGKLPYTYLAPANISSVLQTFLGASTYSRRRIITLLLAAPRTCLIAQHT